MRLTFGKPTSPSLYGKGDQVVYASGLGVKLTGGQTATVQRRIKPDQPPTYWIRFPDGYACAAREFELKRAQ